MQTATTYEVGDRVAYTVESYASADYGRQVEATVTMVRRYKTGKRRYEVTATNGRVYTTGPERMERTES